MGKVEKEWNRGDIEHLVAQLNPLTSGRLREVRFHYDGLFYITGTTIHTKHHHLLFGNSIEECMQLSNKAFELLVGVRWKQLRDLCYKAQQLMSFEGLNSDIKLSNVKPPYSLSKFNILSQHRGVQVDSVINEGKIEIPPVVNLVIALSGQCCEIGRGLFLWQGKKRSSSANHAYWQRVPDVILIDHIWSDEDKLRFQKATYTELRDSLCANLNPLLRETDITLPFLLDFPGETLKNDEDARVTIDVDGTVPPKAAISIPGAAYIGWLDQMQPTRADQVRLEKPVNKRTDGKSGVGYRAEAILTPQQRQQTGVDDVHDMCLRGLAMLDDPIEDGLMLYADVRQLARLARLHMAVEQITIAGDRDEKEKDDHKEMNREGDRERAA